MKIADVGVASTELENTMADMSTFCGTVHYMAPERLRGEHYSYPSDMWSVGVMLYELTTGSVPFPTKRGFFDLLNSIATQSIPPIAVSADFPWSLVALISSCLAKDTSKRVTAAEMVTHPFLAHAPAPASSKATPLAVTSESAAAVVKRWFSAVSATPRGTQEV